MFYAALTPCEELHIIDSIYRIAQCTFADAKRVAEDTFTKIICTNNRENISSSSAESIPDQWFWTFAIDHVHYFQQYSASWLPDLEALIDRTGHADELHSLISLMKEIA